ncbi:unnamed protein product [Amoebophrya sp. A120]|nr:unnamed protein product [Amoebophrya sp. A120]|eukprot:GSA120T00016729001.1
MSPPAPAVPGTLASRSRPCCCLVLVSLLLRLHDDDGAVSVTALSQQHQQTKHAEKLVRREQEAVDVDYDASERPASSPSAPKKGNGAAHYDDDPHRDQPLHAVRSDDFSDMGGRSADETLVTPLHHLLQQIESHGVRVPFFVYDNRELTMNNWTRVCDGDRQGADVSLLQALRKHRWRTTSPEDAEIFVVPTQFSQSRECDRKDGVDKKRGHDRRTRTALDWLFTHSPWFRKRRGRDHLLFANPWYFSRLTNVRDEYIPKDAWPALSETILTREEVIHMSSWENSFERDPEAWWRHPQALFSVPWESTKRSVVTPLEVHPGLEIVPAEFTLAWKNRPHLIFYRTRKPPSAFGATSLRHLPTKNPKLWPNCNIGFDTTREEWLRGWKDAKFCLVIRGDTPSTHALFHAIASSCIPVLIDDSLPHVGVPFSEDNRVAGTTAQLFPSTKNVTSWAVVIPEAEFLVHPERVVSRLEQISDTGRADLLENLREMQPLLLYQHPESQVATLTLIQAAHQRDLSFSEDAAPQR